MATNSSHFLFFSLLTFLALSSASRPVNLTCDNDWSAAIVTWYGNPDGAGNESGGECEYKNAVTQAPFNCMVTAAGPVLFHGGNECGACYLVKCTEHPACSGVPIRVVITDSCHGCQHEYGKAHFDLSGKAFGAMALPGQENNLRNAGTFNIQYARANCDYSHMKIAFRVDQGANPYYFAMAIMYVEGDGVLAAVSLKEGNKGDGWLEMERAHGAIWKLSPNRELCPPFSIRMVSRYSNQLLVADNVIPVGWKPGETYTSLINFL